MLARTVVSAALALFLFTPAVHADCAPGFALTWGTLGGGPGQFQIPFGVAVDHDGYVYVTDEGANRVQKFQPNGTYVMEWSTGTDTSPTGIAIDGDLVYVALNHIHQIQVNLTNGAFVRRFGNPQSQPDPLLNPVGIAIDASGYIYVISQGTSRILKFDRNWAYVTGWGSHGSGPGQFNDPVDIAVDGSSNVYVTDQRLSWVQKFTSTGGYLGSWGTPGFGDGQFQSATGIELDAVGSVYVADGNNNYMQKFTSDGTFLCRWGTGLLTGPIGIAMGSLGQVYVADSRNWRVVAFDYPVPVAPTTWGRLKAAYR